MSTTYKGVTDFVPGQDQVNTLGQFQPANNTLAPNKINGIADAKNGLPSMPTNFNPGLQEVLKDLRILQDEFVEDVARAGLTDTFRKFFKKATLPLHRGSLVMPMLKSEKMDNNPTTAFLTEINTWNPKWNEASSKFYYMEIKTNGYGRYWKKQRLQEELSAISVYAEMSRRFADNANETLNKLAALRMVEGSSKIYTTTAKAYDPTDPYQALLTLGADASTVGANLTWSMLREAVYQMEHYQESYTFVDQTNGTITSKKRVATIGGYRGAHYVALIGANGYSQLQLDPSFNNTFVLNGGVAQQSLLDGTLGITSPVFNIQIEKSPFTVAIKKQATLEVDLDGVGSNLLECAFVIGGDDFIGYELSLEGWTKTISVGYEDDKKVDPFGLLAYEGWITFTDFTVTRPECVYCIPYVKRVNVAAGTITKPDATVTPVFKA